MALTPTEVCEARENRAAVEASIDGELRDPDNGARLVDGSYWIDKSSVPVTSLRILRAIYAGKDWVITESSSPTGLLQWCFTPAK